MISVATRAEMMRIPEAVIVLEDGDVASGEFPARRRRHLRARRRDRDLAGYGDAAPATIFKGVVVALRLKIDGALVAADRQLPRQGVQADPRPAQQDLREPEGQRRPLLGRLGGAGLTTDIAATTAQHPELVQYAATDWDFIVARAEVNGILAWAEAGKLNVKAPAWTGAAALKVTYGIDLLRFDCETDARSQLQSVEATGWSLGRPGDGEGHGQHRQRQLVGQPDRRDARRRSRRRRSSASRARCR